MPKHLQHGSTEADDLMRDLRALGLPLTSIANAIGCDYVTLWRKRTARSGWSRPELAVLRALLAQRRRMALEYQQAVAMQIATGRKMDA